MADLVEVAVGALRTSKYTLSVVAVVTSMLSGSVSAQVDSRKVDEEISVAARAVYGGRVKEGLDRLNALLGQLDSSTDKDAYWRASTGLVELLSQTEQHARAGLDPAGLQSSSDHGEAVPGRTGPHLRDTRGQQGDHRQYQAMGLAAADGYLRAAAGDPHLLQVP
jgi:hypothetical protein